MGFGKEITAKLVNFEIRSFLWYTGFMVDRFDSILINLLGDVDFVLHKEITYRF